MKNLVIFDLDGTLADCRHRLHHIKKETPDWTSFFADCPGDDLIPHTATVFYLIRHNPAYEIWIVSGRSDEVKAQTEKWLLDHHLHPDKLIMRSVGDHTPDETLKGSWIASGLIPKDRVLMVFDDRQRVVDMWRDNGLDVFQVNEGDF